MFGRQPSRGAVKGYGPAERAADPKFEESRERFNEMCGRAKDVESAVESGMTPDDLGRLAELLPALRVLYQERQGFAARCDATSVELGQVLDRYSAERDKSLSSLRAYQETLANVRRNVEARDDELVELHKYRAALQANAAAAAASGPSASQSPSSAVDAERERQVKSVFEQMNEQVRGEVESALSSKATAFVPTHNLIVSALSRALEGLGTSLRSLAEAIPVRPEQGEADEVLAAGARAFSVSEGVGPVKHPKGALPVPPSRKPAQSVAAAQQKQHMVAATAHPLPQVPKVQQAVRDEGPAHVAEPVITEDMAEETKKVLRKRYEEDKAASQKRWELMKRKRELEDKARTDAQTRKLGEERARNEFAKRAEEVESLLKEEREKAEAEEKAAMADAEQKNRKETDNQQKIRAARVAEMKEREQLDDDARRKRRAQEDDERARRHEQWKKDEEERMKAELAAKIRAQEERELQAREEVAKQRQSEDAAIASERGKRNEESLMSLQQEEQRRHQECEAERQRLDIERRERHAKSEAALRAKKEQAEAQRQKDEQTRKMEAASAQLSLTEEVANVTRALEDLDRDEQKEKSKRVQEDIETVERKENERRDQEDRHRKDELERLRKKQEELEALEKVELEKRQQEDSAREHMKQQLLSGHASVVLSSPPCDAQQEPRATSPVSPTRKQLPTPPPKAESFVKKPLPVPGHSTSPVPPPLPPKPVEAVAAAADDKPAVSPGGGGRPFDPAVITVEERAQYEILFVKADLDHDGFVSGSEAKPFFSKSKLDFETLGKVWKLADADEDHKLSPAEFAVAIHLVYGRLRGHEIPPLVPDSLRSSAAAR